MIHSLYNKFLNSSGVATDTRLIEDNSIFFALKGENFNGNKYAKQALEKGASFVVIDESEYIDKENSDNYVLVENVLTTLQELSAYHRSMFKIPVIGITGTNGKTTTKELINTVLSTKFNTFATQGNFNNHIGVPLSLLSITNETEIAIIEMGANHIGEIAEYCKWVKPTLGLVTNMGNAHLEGFGSYENVIKAKSELFNELKSNNKIIFYNNEDELLKNILLDYTYLINYGSEEGVDTQVILINSFPTIEVKFENESIRTNLFGVYNYTNVSAAIAIASYFDIPLNYLKAALENYVPKNNRSQILQKDNNVIILDAYNANPSSVEAVIESFDQLEVQNKVLFLGDMFELGSDSIKLHQQIIAKLEISNISNVVLVGKIYSKCNSFKDFVFLETTALAKEWFIKQQFKLATILIKGSRGMKMESLID